jgi:sulfur carrier protein
MITISVNGRQETVGPATSVSGYLAIKGIDPAVTVVEINKSIVKKEELGTVVLKKNDVVEILRFVGGG